MLRRDSKGKKMSDASFVMVPKVREAISKYGDENVINSTIGSLYDEDGKLVVFDTVVKTYHEQKPEDFAAYASSYIGSEEFKEGVKISVFGENYEKTLENHYVEILASPGGTGAITNTIKNYLNEGDSILLPDWMWSPYKIIAGENQSKSDTYKLFDDNGNFNIKDFEDKVKKYSKIQDNLVVLLNDPCHNPTGYKLSIDEWERVFSVLEEVSKTCDIVLVNDIAYFDYDEKTEEEWEEYRNIFKNRSKNILIIFTFSISKSLTSYGVRVGAQVALSTDKNVVEEFKDACSVTCRGTWSNVSRGGMKIFSDIMLDSEKYRKLKGERMEYVKLVKERAEIFIKEANEVELNILPYKSGFFLTVPTYESTSDVADILLQKNIYTIVLDKGIRIALCSIPKNKVRGLAKKIKESIDEVSQDQWVVAK